MVSAKRLKALVYDPLYIARNSLLYIFGTVLYFVVTGQMSYASLAGFFGFIMTYNSIYYLNDLKDYEEDKRDPYKWQSKPLLNGALKKREAAILYVFYLVSGLLISFSVGETFFQLVVSMLVLNFLHSFLFKKHYTLLFANMVIIQMIKVTLGWISVTSSFADFPLYFVFFIGSTYSLGYLIYKKEKSLIEVNKNKFAMRKREYFKEGVKKVFGRLLGNRTNSLFFMLAAVSLLTSYVLYPFRLHIIVMLLISAAFAVLIKFVKGEKFNLYTTYHIFIVTLLCTIIIAFFLITYVPEFSAINQILA